MKFTLATSDDCSNRRIRLIKSFDKLFHSLFDFREMSLHIDKKPSSTFNKAFKVLLPSKKLFVVKTNNFKDGVAKEKTVVEHGYFRRFFCYFSVFI